MYQILKNIQNPQSVKQLNFQQLALLADEIAEEAEFFSFGTNDLTQMTYGFSRDDAAKFLSDYYAKQIFESDPFAKVDQEGVGQLMKIAVEATSFKELLKRLNEIKYQKKGCRK